MINKFKGISHNFLSVLVSLVNDSNFLMLSDIDILKILQENDIISIPTSSYQCSIRYLIKELINYNKKHHQQENKIVKNLGGLYVIGTERNDSRRIDNQLRGRCGRQGDPGSSRFFLSLDDNLLRLFGGTKVQSFIKNQITDDSPLESQFINKSLDSAQERVEERAYEQRKALFDYDDILNQQRKIVYFERRLILEKKSVRKNSFSYGEQIISDFISRLENNQITLKEFIKLFENLFGKNLEVYLPLTMLPKLEGTKFYFHEIIGFKVTDQRLGDIGTVHAILDNAAQPIFEIFKGQKQVLVPMIDSFIIEVNRKEKELVLNTPIGLVDLYLE